MNKLLLGAMNNNKRYNRPFQLQVNVPRTIGILRDVVPNFCFGKMGFSVWGSRFEDGHPFVRFLWFPPWYFRVIFNTRLLVPILNNRREGDR